VLRRLVEEAARLGRGLYVADDPGMIRWLATLAGRATAALFADEAVHAELWTWLRLDPRDPAYRRDGLTADCLGLSGPALWLVRRTMPPARMRWLSRVGLHHLLASDTARVARRSAAICLLTTPVRNRAALVDTGRVLLRLWLLAADAGLVTHPLSALLDCSETAGPTAAAFGVALTPGAAVFRLGYAAPAPRAPRLPLDELLIGPPELSEGGGPAA
jgi:hypothetical protein